MGATSGGSQALAAMIDRDCMFGAHAGFTPG